MLEKELKDIKEKLEFVEIMDAAKEYKLKKYEFLILQLNEILISSTDMSQIDIFNDLVGDSKYTLKEILDKLDLNLDDYTNASHSN
jgi:hypothetical protein